MKNNKFKSITKDILYWGMFVLIGIIVLFILMEAIIPKQTINVFQIKSYISTTDRMEPKINPGDLVFIDKVNPENLSEGDLVTFMADSNYDGDTEMVTFYVDDITLIEDDLYRVSVIVEDSNTPFGVITSDRIVGGYAFRLPGVGNVINFIKSPFGIGTIVINVLIVVGIVIIVKQGHKKEEKEVVENSES